MTHEEFIEALYQVEDCLEELLHKPSEEEFRAINLVYMYHPAISHTSDKGREQIAELYAVFGMTLIWDMIPRAEAILKAEDAVTEAKVAYENAEQALEELHTCERLPQSGE